MLNNSNYNGWLSPDQNLIELQERIILAQDQMISNLGKIITLSEQLFESEKNIKNNLYAFIMEEGLFFKLREYSLSNDMKSPDGHLKAIKLMIMNLPENSN